MISFSPLDKFQRAAEYARNALHGRAPVIPTEWSLWAGRVYHSTIYRNLYLLVMLCLCALAWWEPLVIPKKKPGAAARLLLFGDDPSDSPDADGEVVGNVLSAAALAAVRATDGICIFFAVFDLWLQERYHGLRGARRGWLVVKTIVTLALFSNWVAVLAKPTAPYWTRALRPILLLERMRNVRKVAGNIVRSIPAILNVGLLLLMNHAFFAVLGVVLFSGIDEDNCTRKPRAPLPSQFGCTAFWEDDDNPNNPFACKAFFNSLDEASIQLFSLVAGSANFPNFMIPVYRCNPANAFYFVAYVITTTYFLATIGLAVAAKAFNDHQREETVLKFSRMIGGLDIAYAQLTGASDLMVIAEDAVTAGSGRNRVLLHSPAGKDPSSPPRLPTASLKLADLVVFFGAFSPGVSPGAVERLAQVVDAECKEQSLSGPPAVISRDGFRKLMLHFGRIRTNTSTSAAGVAAAERDAALQQGGVGALAALLRCGGRDALGLLAPTSAAAAEVEDAEWLDGDSLVQPAQLPQAAAGAAAGAASSASSGAAEAWAASTAGGAKVVANPLAAIEAGQGSVNDGSGGAPEGGLTPIRIPPPSPSPADAVGGWGEAAQPRKARAAAAEQDNNLCVSAWETAKRGCLSMPSYNPSLDPRAGPLRVQAAAFLGSPYANFIFDGAIVIFCIGELWELNINWTSNNTNISDLTLSNLLILELFCLAVFLAEFLLKMFVWGPAAYFSARLVHKLDMAILLIALVLGSLAAAGAGGVDRPTALSILFLRALRLGRYLSSIHGFTATSSAMADLLPMLVRYLAVVVSVMYCFAIIGCNLFAGRLDDDKWPDVKNSSFGNSPLEGALSFDSFHKAMAVLFYVQMLNDWPVIMEGLVLSFQNIWPRAFFVLYIIIMCAIVINVVLGFLIEAYGVEKRKRDALERYALKGGSEASVCGGISDWRSMIRKSGVSFSGYYLARTRHYTDAFDTIYREDVKERLPALFNE